MNFVRKRLRRASFGGHWFYLNDTNIETGRRVGRYEFPFQDQPNVQDLGKQGQVISISGFVAGANYRSDADKLLSECEKKGPTEFFHPYYGRRKVVCRSCRVNENNVEGGVIYFLFQFFETVDTVASTFGLQNLPILGLTGGADLLASASQSIGEAIDSANDVVGYVDQLNDSILMTTEFIERMFSPLLHTEDSINNLALSLNDMRRTVQKDYYQGTTGMVHAFSNLASVIAGTTIDDTDPYHWTHEFPRERIDPWYPFWPILFGVRVFTVGMQATHVFSNLSRYALSRQLQELKALKINLDRTILDAGLSPDIYRQLKDLNVIVIRHLFESPLAEISLQESTTPKKCLILEAYEEQGGLEALDSIMDQYRYSNTL